MKGSDLIVSFLASKGVGHVFGYPGGMVTHLMDSLSRQPGIQAHVACHEQGAAFMACGYAQATGRPGFAYATSGPGATNLVTGICHAWFDSVPVLFVTGQVNSFERRGKLPVRQRGFQETDIVSMVAGVTKYASCIDDPACLGDELCRAWEAMTTGRKGPVLLDVCMDVSRSEAGELINHVGVVVADHSVSQSEVEGVVVDALAESRRPVLLLGNGVKSSGAGEAAKVVARALSIPVVTSMPAFDVLGPESQSLGFVGAYGSRAANFAVAKSDLVISVGARMDVRQVGADRSAFAPGARILRFDVDQGELAYKVHADEVGIVADAGDALRGIGAAAKTIGVCYGEWLRTCTEIRSLLSDAESFPENAMMAAVGDALPESAVVVSDVGQNQVWVAQSVRPKKGQKFLFSGGHGAMGYSLPAAIGACLATGKTAISMNGDGGLQMNIQELQVIAREQLPIKVVVFNNRSLGMIRHFQEMYFKGRCAQTTESGGYLAPDFEAIARAYGLLYSRVGSPGDASPEMFEGDGPLLVEVLLDERTHVFPKLEFGKPNQDQEPLISRDLYRRIMEM